MFNKKNIYFHHHVHRLQQILREIALFEEERIEAVVHIILEIVQRAHFGKNTFGYLLVVAQYFFQRVAAELHACLQVQVLAEREAAQVITFYDVPQFQVLLFQAHHGRTGKDNLQIGKAVVAQAQFLAPVRMLEYLVYQQYFSAAALKFVSEVHDAVTGKVEVIHVDEEARTVGTEFLFGVLQQECGFTYPTSAFDTDKTVVPVNLVHEVAANGGIRMLYQISVCSVKCFHALNSVYRATNIRLFYRIAK